MEYGKVETEVRVELTRDGKSEEWGSGLYVHKSGGREKEVRCQRAR